MEDLREGYLTILGEHSRDDVRDDVELGEIRGSDVDEDIPRVECDLAMLRVDDGRHREDTVFGVVDDRVDR